MRAARLNESGIREFSGWLDAVKSDSSLLPPLNLLSDNAASEPLEVEFEVEVRAFESRLDAAAYLHERFVRANAVNVDKDRGLWSWLSLFYIDAVCPVRSGGIRNPGALARHVPDPENFQRYYRHLLAGPYRIYRAHRDDPSRAMALLCQKLDVPGDVVEQLASRQELVTNPGIMGLASLLYVDTEKSQLKRGAGGKGGGSARRLSDIIEQFDLTWDLYSAAPQELSAVLPKEFSKFLPE